MKRTLILVTAVAAGISGWSVWHQGTRVQAQTGYTLNSVKGTYGFVEQGTLGQSSPEVAAGVIVADGNGGITGSETLQVYGSGAQTLTFQGNYTVNSDGTGSLILNYPPENPVVTEDGTVFGRPPVSTRYNFVIVNNKLELHAVRAENGALITATFTRQ